jgi:DNA-binding transcriptional MerR regulator
VDDKAPGAREYRVEELARAAGIPVRTLRFYRERRLLPPPRRDGRIAWYSEDHLARLRTIAALLDRGHTLGGIADLIAAWEKGRTLDGVAELLGLESALTTPWSDETPVRLTPQELADYFGADVSPENLTSALEIGYIAVDGENVIHISRRLLDASAALVREGVPLSAVLDAGRQVRAHVDAIADLFTQVVKAHVLGPGAASGVPTESGASDALGPASAPAASAEEGADATAAPTGGAGAAPDIAGISQSLQRLRPLAKNIVEAEMSLAMDRRVRAEIDAWMREGAPPGAAAGRGGAPTDSEGDGLERGSAQGSGDA